MYIYNYYISIYYTRFTKQHVVTAVVLTVCRSYESWPTLAAYFLCISIETTYFLLSSPLAYRIVGFQLGGTTCLTLLV